MVMHLFHLSRSHLIARVRLMTNIEANLGLEVDVSQEGHINRSAEMARADTETAAMFRKVMAQINQGRVVSTR